MTATKKIKRRFSLLLVFAVLLIAGVAYAASNGVLIFNGVVNLGPAVDVEAIIVPQGGGTFTGSNGESGDMVVNSDGSIATITVDLKNPGDAVTLQFQVRNTGATDIEITDVTTSDILDSSSNVETNAITISGDYATDLEGETIDAGDISGIYDITVEWPDDADAEDFRDETFTFTIAVDYAAV